MTLNIMAMNKPVSKSVVVRKKQQTDLVLDDDSVKTWIKQSNNVTNMMADYNVIQMRILVIVMEAMQEAINGNINHHNSAQLELFQMSSPITTQNSVQHWKRSLRFRCSSR